MLARHRSWLRSRPVVATKANFATLYAVDGALLPFLSVFLAYVHGMSPARIGFVLAAASVAAVIAPPVLTVLADRYGHAERLLTLMLFTSAAALFVFALAGGFWWVLVSYVGFSLARDPARPLLDGIFFASQRTIPALGAASYHRVRLWGTFGYMVPGVLLYFAIQDREALGILPWVACGLALVGALATLYLPTRYDHGAGEVAAGPVGGTRVREMLGAVGQLLRRRTTAMFVLAMFLLNASMAAYAVFYPLLLTETVGLAPRWLGPVANIGVALELAYMAAFGWFVRRLGWRWFMVIGALAATLRMVLLATTPTVAVAVGTQVLHGLVIVVTMVAGRVILDRQAPDEIRHTAQGLYAMIVVGGGRVVGSAVGGLVAAAHLSAVFWGAGGAALIGGAILVWALREERSVPSPVRLG